MYSILDIGCGHGEFLHSLPGTFKKIGLDLSYEALTKVQALKTLGCVESLPFGSLSFDLVTGFELLEHLPYRIFHQALRELERVSRKYIMISVPNREVLMESLVWCPCCSCAFNASWHLRSFDETKLDKLFTGFRMVEYRPCGPVVRYGSSKLTSLALLLARRRPPAGALCPQCGYSEADDSESCEMPTEMPARGAYRQRFCGIARMIVQRVLFGDRRRYWLLALYARVRGEE